MSSRRACLPLLSGLHGMSWTSCSSFHQTSQHRPLLSCDHSSHHSTTCYKTGSCTGRGSWAPGSGRTTKHTPYPFTDDQHWSSQIISTQKKESLSLPLNLLLLRSALLFGPALLLRVRLLFGSALCRRLLLRRRLLFGRRLLLRRALVFVDRLPFGRGLLL